jgi:LPXTG-site transpeptidase (sortase) family protein
MPAQSPYRHEERLQSSPFMNQSTSGSDAGIQKQPWDLPTRIPASQSTITNAQKGSAFSRAGRLIPAILITMGSMILANVLWPIVSYQLFEAKQYQKGMVSPVETEIVQNATAQPANAEPVEAAEFARTIQQLPKQTARVQPKPSITPKILDTELDYTNLAAWFPSQTMPEMKPEEAATYLIDIPALKIERAEVRVGGLNLDKGLVQYPGTANPGELGSPVIFGHSVSPLFYNPSTSNPKRYISIFTKIMDLKSDDKISVTYDGVVYTYRVTNKMIVKPEDVEILRQNYSTRELKLITCHPAGTYLKRAIVFAQLESMQ